MFYLKNHGALIYAVSDAFTIPHGFATRIGGVSTLPHVATLNFTTSTGDSEENIAENYNRLLSAVGMPPKTQVSANQIHSANVMYVTENHCTAVIPDCDGFVTDRPGVTLVVRTADCVPILFADAEAKVIGAVHAGWRGTVAGIAPACIDRMVKLGAAPQRITAVIGPCIHACCYTVGEDFRKEVVARQGEAFASRFVKEEKGRLAADLVEMNRALLMEAGITRIDASPECTCCNPSIYHSHRATNGNRGVMAAVIGMTK